MKALTLQQIADFSGGVLASGAATDVVSSVSTDTRTIQTNALYVALSGENFDGHNFAASAVKNGATAVLINDSRVVDLPDDCNVIRVADTLLGLQSLAREYRKHLGIRVVAITGSNGKTSTKDMVASVLREGFKVSATKGNLNNHIGLPLTILSAEEDDDCGVWEMGMSNPGEIEVLASIGAPDIGVITNVGVAHIEFMGSRDAIAMEKGMLAEAIGEDGCVILNGEDDYSASIAERTNALVVMTGHGGISAEEVKILADSSEFVLRVGGETIEAKIPVAGKHMVENALLAVAVGLEFGMTLEKIVAGLAGVEFTGGRLQRKSVNGIIFIDDSYNANPDSMKAAVDTFVALPSEGRKFVVAGGMAELGASSEDEHERIGKMAAESGVDFVVSVGNTARAYTAGLNGSSKASVSHFDDQFACGAWLKSEAREGDMVLVKGSRSTAMEKVITAFTEAT